MCICIYQWCILHSDLAKREEGDMNSLKGLLPISYKLCYTNPCAVINNGLQAECKDLLITAWLCSSLLPEWQLLPELSSYIWTLQVISSSQFLNPDLILSYHLNPKIKYNLILKKNQSSLKGKGMTNPFLSHLIFLCTHHCLLSHFFTGSGEGWHSHIMRRTWWDTLLPEGTLMQNLMQHVTGIWMISPKGNSQLGEIYHHAEG